MKRTLTQKARLFWPVFLVLLLADCSSKRLALEHLVPHVPEQVVGDVVRFTLAFNTGAAFGLSVGPASRWVFTILALAAIGLLVWLYRDTHPRNTSRTLALALLFGGAVGNLIDRIFSARGVVDFIDIGLGGVRWWTFNVADMGITVGGLLLAWQLWQEERARPGEDRAPAGAGRPPNGG